MKETNGIAQIKHISLAGRFTSRHRLVAGTDLNQQPTVASTRMRVAKQQASS